MFSKILPLTLQGNPRFWSTKEHSYPDILPFCFLGLIQAKIPDSDGDGSLMSDLKFKFE